VFVERQVEGRCRSVSRALRQHSADCTNLKRKIKLQEYHSVSARLIARILNGDVAGVLLRQHSADCMSLIVPEEALVLRMFLQGYGVINF
jgi:hypothetical protein